MDQLGKPRQHFSDVYGSRSRPYAETRTLAAHTI
jgi:hypothetical protein